MILIHCLLACHIDEKYDTGPILFSFQVTFFFSLVRLQFFLWYFGIQKVLKYRSLNGLGACGSLQSKDCFGETFFCNSLSSVIFVFSFLDPCQLDFGSLELYLFLFFSFQAFFALCSRKFSLILSFFFFPATVFLVLRALFSLF